LEEAKSFYIERNRKSFVLSFPSAPKKANEIKETAAATKEEGSLSDFERELESLNNLEVEKLRSIKIGKAFGGAS
jgi:hypothetical protein